MKNPTNPYYQALMARFEAERQEALATLHTYFNNAVGIGEHPQHLDEMAKAADRLATAEDKIASVQRNFTKDGALLQQDIVAELSDNGQAKTAEPTQRKEKVQSK
jgi:hypothetical protein